MNTVLSLPLKTELNICIFCSFKREVRRGVVAWKGLDIKRK
jgi:hypothetical protein